MVNEVDTGERPCGYIVGETARFELFSHFRFFQEADAPALDIPEAGSADHEKARALKLRLVKAGYFNQIGAAGKFCCPNCTKCFMAAVKVGEFEPNRSQRKVLLKNQDIKFSVTSPFATREVYDLFLRYLKERHPRAEMRDWSFDDFRTKTMTHSHVAVLTLKDKIVGMSLIDSDKEIIVGDYCFYDPDLKERALGRLMDLSILIHAYKQGIPFVSFGALNDESPKLRHKGDYKGTHIFKDGEGWVPYSKPKPL